MLWQLTQMLWVGGLWLLHIGLLPVLGRIGLAPLLIDEIAGMLEYAGGGIRRGVCDFSGFGAGYRPRALPVYGGIFAGNCC